MKRKADRVISFPIIKTQLFGWPPMLRLTAVEAEAVRRVFLGGMEALRQPDYHCACKTVGSLSDKGLLGRDGLTDIGRAVGEAVALADHERCVDAV